MEISLLMKKTLLLILSIIVVTSCTPREPLNEEPKNELSTTKQNIESYPKIGITYPVLEGWLWDEYVQGEHQGFEWVYPDGHKINVIDSHFVVTNGLTMDQAYWFYRGKRLFKVLHDSPDPSGIEKKRILTAKDDQKILQFIGAGTEFENWVSKITYDDGLALSNDLIDEGFNKENKVSIGLLDTEEVNNGRKPIKDWIKTQEIYLETSDNIAYYTLKTLVEGLWQENFDGLSSAIPRSTKILELSVIEGVAYANFSSELEEGGGAASNMAKLAQIESTLMQFPDVNGVTVAVEGNTEDILQP